MKSKSYLFSFFLFTSISFAQIVDVFFSDYYIGWRGGGIYNNLFELYNPKEDTIDLADYVIRRSQNGSEWRSSEAPFDAADFIRVPGIIPPGETFTMTRASADEALTNDYYEKGPLIVEWDGKNDEGSSVVSGAYFYMILTENKTITKKMLFVK